MPAIEKNNLANQLQQQKEVNSVLEEQIEEEVVIEKIQNEKCQMVWTLFADIIIIQLYVNGTRLSAIAENIATQA